MNFSVSCAKKPSTKSSLLLTTKKAKLYVRTAAARTSSSVGQLSPRSHQRKAHKRPAGGFMQFANFSFGSLRIDGKIYENDVVIDRGEIRKRKKKPSKQFRDDFDHTPVSLREKIP